MHHRPHQESQKRRSPKTYSPAEPSKSTQHGCLLLDVPGEILCAITANLDPPALNALGQTHKHFSRHVEQDSTWRSAYEAHYGTDLLRRSQPTWRREFSERHRLLLRFGLSRVPSTTHAPLPAQAISHLHLLSSGSGLLSLSLTHGLIARSVPFTGRVLPAFIDAFGSTTSRGIHTDVAPDVSACAVSSTGGTVRLLWGYRTGQIAFMLTNRTMENPRRPAAEFRMCEDIEMHHGSVRDLVWMADGDSWLAASGGSDGVVKLWNFSPTSTRGLLWTSDTSLPTDPCIKVAASRVWGMVVAARKSGAVDIWSGFNLTLAHPENSRRVTVLASALLCRTNYNDAAKVLALHIDQTTRSIVVAFHGDICFYRISLTPTGSTVITAHGAPEGGAILSALQAHFTPSDGEKSFILTGDKLGSVSVYDWDSSPPAGTSDTVHPMRTFQAIPPPTVYHASGSQTLQESVTALTWTPTVLVTGTSSGAVTIWDSLTFERIRTIVRPVGLRRVRGRRGQNPHNHQQNNQGQPEADDLDEDVSSAVKQILVGEGGDSLIVNVGGEVIAWRAGDINISSLKSGSGSSLRVGKGARNATGSGTSRLELAGATGRRSAQLETKQTISESHQLYKHGLTEDLVDPKEEKARRQRAINERVQRNHLKRLGLSESEALEYALMLSREGEGASGASTASLPGGSGANQINTPFVEGSLGNPAFMGNALTDEQVQATLERPASPGPSPSSSISMEFPTIRHSTPTAGSPGTTPISASPETHPASLVPSAMNTRRLSFASSASSASTKSSKSGRSGGSSSSSSSNKGSAWNVPLRRSAARSGAGTGSSPDGRRGRGPNASASLRSGGGGPLGGLDDDLRFALELSLAEARSRGEAV